MSTDIRIVLPPHSFSFFAHNAFPPPLFFSSARAGIASRGWNTQMTLGECRQETRDALFLPLLAKTFSPLSPPALLKFRLLSRNTGQKRLHPKGRAFSPQYFPLFAPPPFFSKRDLFPFSFLRVKTICENNQPVDSRIEDIANILPVKWLSPFFSPTHWI